jgi:diguanylate cyclase (GGDEF)-like protein
MTDRIEKLETDLNAAEDPRRKIDLLNLLAWELRDLDTKRGLSQAQKAYQLAEAAQYRKGLADSIIAQSQYIYKNYVLALSQGMQALSIYEQIGDLAGQSRAFYTLSWAHWAFDNFVEAAELGQRAHKIAHEIGDPVFEADTLNNLGLIHKRSGNFDLAYSFYNQALAINRSLGDKIRECKVLTNIALANAAQGNYERALEYAHKSLELEIDSPLFTGYTYLVLGQAYTGIKKFDQAEHYLEEAISFARAHEIEQLLLTAMESVGELYLERQEPDLAITHLQEALALANETKSSLYLFRCHEILSQIYEDRGDLNLALSHYKDFHTVKENLFNDNNTNRLQALEIQHRSEIARREAEIYQLRNVELEKELVEHKRLEELLQQQAATDVLTGISNRRHFLAMAEHELKRALHLHQPLTLALIDIDHFKPINDRFGHSSGDRALVEFANIIKENIREIDIFARFGGDEFVLLFPQTNRIQAVAIIERIRNALTARQINLSDTPVAVTISTGIAGFEGEQDSVDELLKRADKGLYKSKEMGRNHISVEPLSD